MLTKQASGREGGHCRNDGRDNDGADSQ